MDKMDKKKIPKQLYLADRSYVFWKMFLDIFLSLVLLPFSILLILLFSFFIFLESPGNPFFLQERVGLNGKCFKIYKLRSMYLDAEAQGHKWAEKNDNRITKVGKFIRKTRIDELPQLFNVLKGDMSFIGPRPERPVFIREFLKECPDFNDRLAVKPGITGWAQINGGYELSPSEKLTYDKYYIEHQGFYLDCLILVKTVKIVFTGDGAR
ncbi:sugar transferase [Streptococcus cristatus]